MSKLNISRRDFLKAAGVSAAALGLTACGGSSSSTAASGSASAAGSTASAGGSNWPTDTVSFYVPAKAGGGTDMTARVFLQGINEVHPGNYIVVNDVTGGGTVAAENVRNAKPDGLNLLAYHTGLCTSIASGQYAHDLSEFTICGMFITVPDEATGGLFVPGNSKFDKLSLKQLNAPCIVYNLNGYYDGLKAMLKHMIDMGLSSEERQKGIYFAERLEQITDILCSLKED